MGNNWRFLWWRTLGKWGKWRIHLFIYGGEIIEATEISEFKTGKEEVMDVDQRTRFIEESARQRMQRQHLKEGTNALIWLQTLAKGVLQRRKFREAVMWALFHFLPLILYRHFPCYFFFIEHLQELSEQVRLCAACIALSFLLILASATCTSFTFLSYY